MLNDAINTLRAESAAKTEGLEALQYENGQLKEKLNECMNAPKEVETIVQNTHSKSLESVITFGQGKATVSADQLPNVERIATYMKIILLVQLLLKDMLLLKVVQRLMHVLLSNVQRL